MSLSDELSSLEQMHQRGALSADEFARAKARLLGRPAGTGNDTPRLAAAVNGFRRSAADRWLGGVCGGLVQLTGMAAWIWRLVFTLLAACGGTGVLLYLLLWFFVPLEPAPAAHDAGKLGAH